MSLGDLSGAKCRVPACACQRYLWASVEGCALRAARLHALLSLPCTSYFHTFIHIWRHASQALGKSLPLASTPIYNDHFPLRARQGMPNVCAQI